MCVTDPKHLRKNTRNSIYSGARMLSFGDSYVGFQHVFDLANNPESVLFHGDVYNVDRQDDSAAYRLFSPEFFLEVSNSIISNYDNKGLFIYLYVFGK